MIYALIWKDVCTSMVIATLFTTAKTWKQPKRPLTQSGTPNGYYLAHTKNEFFPFAATWIDVKVIIPSELSQIEKDN